MSYISNGTILTSLGYKLPDGITISSIEDLNYLEDGLTANKFFSQLINKIGLTYFNKLVFQNDFARFMRDKLEFAKIIEDIYVDMPEGKKFDYDTADASKYINKNQKANVTVTYKDRNYQSVYAMTVSSSEIASAFTTRNGLQNLVTRLMDRLYTRAEVDIYNYCIATLSVKDQYTQNEWVKITKPTDASTSKAFLKKVAEYKDLFSRPSNAYNSLGVDAITPKNKMVLVVRDDIMRSVDYDFLSGVFNLSKVETDLEIIKVHDFGVCSDDEDDSTIVADDTILAVLMDADRLNVHPTFTMADEFRNGYGRFTNYFLHKDYNTAIRLGLNAVMFSTADYPSAVVTAKH